MNIPKKLAIQVLIKSHAWCGSVRGYNDWCNVRYGMCYKSYDNHTVRKSSNYLTQTPQTKHSR